MGFVLSKFRKEKSTQVILEGLQAQIQELEKHMINTQEKKRRFVANFVGFTIGAYIVGFALFYFFYFPPTTQGRIMYLVPLLLFPVLIILLRQMFTWYFQRKLNKNGDKLSQLKEKKSKILEQVMDKETYKVAVNLLERFGDKKQSRLTGQLATQTRAQSLQSLSRTLTGTPKPSTPQPAAASQQPQRPLTPYTSAYRNVNNNLNSSALSLTSSSPHLAPGQELRRRTPFPITDDRSRSALDRLMDFIVGDTPSNRFGMICKECHAHNGMLPQEEYEYTTFRCAFCNALNPSRKKRPVGPLIMVDAPPGSQTPLSARRNESSDSDSSSDEERTSTVDKQPLIRRALLPDLPATATNENASEAKEINSTTVTEMEIDEQTEEVEPEAEPKPELEPEPESETVISKAVAEELAIK